MHEAQEDIGSEYRQLNLKIKSYKEFVETSEYGQLDCREAIRIRHQLSVMVEYSETLKERIDFYTEVTQENKPQ